MPGSFLLIAAFAAMGTLASVAAIAHPGHRTLPIFQTDTRAQPVGPAASGQVVAAGLIFDVKWEDCLETLEHYAALSSCSIAIPEIAPMITHLDEERYSADYNVENATVSLNCMSASFVSLSWMGSTDVPQVRRQEHMQEALDHWRQTGIELGTKYYRYSNNPVELLAPAGTVLKEYGKALREISLGKVISVMRRLRIDLDTCKQNFDESSSSCIVAALPSWRIDHPGDPGGGEPICQDHEAISGSKVTLCVDAFASSYSITHTNNATRNATPLGDIAEAISAWTQRSPFQVPFTVLTTEDEERSETEKHLIQDTRLGEPTFAYREITRISENLCQDNFISQQQFCEVRLEDLPEYYFQHVANADQSFYRITDQAIYGVHFLNELDRYRVHYRNKDRTPTQWSQIESVMTEFANSGEAISAYRIVQPK